MCILCIYNSVIHLYVNILSSSLHGHAGAVDHIALSGRTLVSAGSEWYDHMTMYICICSFDIIICT